MTAMLLKVLCFNTKQSKPSHGCQPERSGNLIRLCESVRGKKGISGISITTFPERAYDTNLCVRFYYPDRII